MSKAPRSGAAGAKSRQVARGRSSARLAAIQALYQLEMSGASTDQVLREFVDQRLGEAVDGMVLAAADRRLFAELVRGVAAERAELDDMLAAVLDQDWPVERLETLLLVLLRAGVYELASRRAVPIPVVISEYLAVADAFFSGKEPAMVNGVLERVACALRPAELAPGEPA